MIYIDAGTTYSKIIEIDNNSLTDIFSDYYIKTVNNRNYYIVPSSKIRKEKLTVRKSCGHMSDAKENEIIALANGAKDIIEPDSTILDLGSRDSKWVRFRAGKFHDMDWNTSCASSTGATVEMLLKFYNLNISELKFNEEKFAVTCGIFGLEKIMDSISNGAKPEEAISKFIHGIAYNAWCFSKKPEKIYLSGGFCENKCFVDSLRYYTDVRLLGRFVLCEGLIASDNLVKEVAHA